MRPVCWPRVANLHISTRRNYEIDHSIQSSATNNQGGQRTEHNKPTYFDIEELRSWLIRCNEGHRGCKSSAGLSESLIPRGFRLIDVKRGCIVRAESDLTYCALSYVWGRVDQVVLNKFNFMELEKEHALFGDKFVLPKTITDAIKLCQDIGQTYLWVDCLCIIQDEEEDKLIQMHAMDSVYNSAFLTIVAAAGDDANAGLSPFNSPRFKPSLSISIETISGNTIISSPSPIIAVGAIIKSAWTNRGWTLQEYALSKRVVIFTGQYVFFPCEEALRGEDFGLKLSSFGDNWPGWELPLHRFSAPQSVSRHYSNVYPQLAAQYVRRVLTNEEDVLNAFLGILQRLQTCPNSNFAVGYLRLDVAWRERQPEMLEFAVTTIGVNTVRTFRRTMIRLGLMLIENCDDTALKVYRRIPATNTTIDQYWWPFAEPQQRLLALI